MKSYMIMEYYGIQVPDDFEDKDTFRVFEDRTEALKKASIIKGARFKKFLRYEEAANYAKTPYIKSSENVDSEKSEYETPEHRDFINLRLAIEKNNLDTFISQVNGNPKFLITSFDTPTKLYGGKYSPLHMVAQYNRPEMARIILSNIQNKDYVAKVYNKTEQSHINLTECVKHLLDMYINMPDPKLFETPLHFAAKFGSLEVVRILVSFPECNKNIKSKKGQTAAEIACSRVTKENERLKDDIISLINCQHYMTVFRDPLDRVIVGKPWFPQSLQQNVQESSCTYEVSGFIGPMSPTQVDSLRKKWGKLPMEEKQVAQIDARGYEKICRRLAREVGSPWKEYWQFMDAGCDLSSEEGLQKLEAHLKIKTKEALSKTDLNHSSFHAKYSGGTDSPMTEILKSMNKPRRNQDNIIIRDSNLLLLQEIPECVKNTSKNVEKILLSLKSIQVKLKRIKNQLYMLQMNFCNGDVKMDRSSIHEKMATLCLLKLTNVNRKELERMKHINKDTHTACFLSHLTGTAVCKCSWTVVNSGLAKKFYTNYLYPSNNNSDSDRLYDDEVDDILAGRVCKVLTFDDEEQGNGTSAETRDIFHTPPESPIEEPVTPEEGKEVYIAGESLSVEDKHAYEALEELTIDIDKYPYIGIWKHLVSLRKNDANSFRKLTNIRTESPLSRRNLDPLLGSPLRRGSPVLDILGLK